MQIETRRHYVQPPTVVTTSETAQPVTLRRLPWEPAETRQDPRPETAPSERISMRRPISRAGEGCRIAHVIAAFRAAHFEAVEELA